MAEREAQVAAEEAEAAAGAERATVAGAAGAAPRPPPRPVTQLTLSMQAAVWAAAPAARAARTHERLSGRHLRWNKRKDPPERTPESRVFQSPKITPRRLQYCTCAHSQSSL